MNTIRLDKIIEVESISEFIIKGRYWFTYYNDISESIKVVDKILGASLPRHVLNEKDARIFLLSISDVRLESVFNKTKLDLKALNIKYPIN